jgi:hypothetical protein
MGTITTKTLSNELFRKLIKGVFISTGEKLKDEYTGLFWETTTDELDVIYHQYAGIGLPEEIPQGQSFPTKEPIKGNNKTLTQTKYGYSIRFTEEFKRFNQWSVVEQLMKELRTHQSIFKNQKVFSVYNNAFSNSYDGWDTGKAMCATNHTLLNGDTFSNKPSTNLQLSVASLLAGLIHFDDIVNDQGLPYFQEPRNLIVPTALYPTARELLYSTGKPHEISNTLNIFQDYELQIRKVHYLTSPTAWFITTDAEKFANFAGPSIVTAAEPDIVVQAAADNSRDTIVSSRQFFAAGYGGFLFVYGSPGA